MRPDRSGFGGDGGPELGQPIQHHNGLRFLARRFPSYPSAQAMLSGKVADAGDARMYAGLHCRFDITAGQELGGKVAPPPLTKVPKANVAIPLN